MYGSEGKYTTIFYLQMEHFEKEMRDLKGRASRSSGVVGSKEEITLLKKKTENISNFWTEIRKTTQVNQCLRWHQYWSVFYRLVLNKFEGYLIARGNYGVIQ